MTLRLVISKTFVYLYIVLWCITLYLCGVV
nr:MAG TPA: hypothetical protein [Caudoviricetes sp.]DAU90422.1 MAG TPA: hypothetical protein [Caudoviricetes sp.]